MSCPDCFKGSKNAGTPTGKVTTLHGLPTYIASPSDGTKAIGTIIYIPDVFGWDFVSRHFPYTIVGIAKHKSAKADSRSTYRSTTVCLPMSTLDMAALRFSSPTS